MGIGAVIFLILLGLILIWLELLVIPGTTIAGIGGILLVGAGVYIAFDSVGTAAGVWSLAGSLVLLIVSIVFFLKSNTWKKLSLNDAVQSKVEYYKEDSIKPGDTATAVSRLSPSGTVRVNDITVEAESLDGMIDPGTKLKVIEVRKNRIIVRTFKK
ncbi:MAG: NfeD family protein [Bacteroidales bacterium]|jgi:membrane-bound ClpP family serine protease